MKRKDIIEEECKAEAELWNIQHEGYFGVQDTIKLIDDIKVEMFAKGVKYANRWIDVSDELPNTTKSVLVKGTIPSGEETIQVARLYKRGWVTDTYFKVDVKAWKIID